MPRLRNSWACWGSIFARSRIVPDVEAEIVAALNALRVRYSYVFTTGGIGPTHDDITADAVGEAFELPVEHNPEAMALLAARYSPGEFNERRQRMARMPRGARLIHNPVSVAPGFQIGNVFVMAGVPKIMQAMLEDVAPRLTKGGAGHLPQHHGQAPRGGDRRRPRGDPGRHPGLSIGSYPFFAAGDPAPGQRWTVGTTLVVRGRDEAEVQAAAQEIEALARAFGVDPEIFGKS